MIVFLTVLNRLQQHTTSMTLSSYKHTIKVNTKILTNNNNKHKILQESLEVRILQLVLPQTQDLNYIYQ